MQNLIPLLLIGFIVYLILSRRGRGGMGCCGGHSPDEHKQQQHSNSGDLSQDRMEKVIDLRKDEYTVLSSDTDQRSSKIEI